jgi:hypothetical protein
MKAIRLGLHTLLGAALLSAAVAAYAEKPVSTPAAPVPSAIHNAKKIFVSNAGADSGLFPSPFSGDPNRAYNQFYASLKATNQYELVSNPSEADLVLELRLFAPYGPTNGNKVYGASDPLPDFRLVIYDRYTHFVLWTLTESIESAVGQQNHDHTFDVALMAILSDFENLSGKAPVASH